MQLLVRNRVKDFAAWRGYLEADKQAAAEYGLELISLWRSNDDPNEAFFLLEVEDIERALAFMARPESREIGEKSGVIDALTKVLVGLYEVPEKPGNAIDFIKE